MPFPPVDTVLERAGSDPDFETGLRAAYQGRHDVLDALWWAAHPLTSSPRGVADPARELRDLQRAAFSRSDDRTPEEVQEAERRLHEVERMLAEDSRRLADAITAVESIAPAIKDPRAEDNVPLAEGSAGPLRKYLVPLASVAAVLAAILVFPAISGINADAEPSPTPTPTSTSPIAERVQTKIITFDVEGNVGDPMAILERPQTPDDLPAGVELRFSPETYRALPELVPHAQLYLARGDEPNWVCFLVTRDDGVGISTCQPESQLSDQPMRLGGGRYEIAPEMTILTESYELSPGGDIDYEATARVTGRSSQLVDGSAIFEGD